MSNVIPQQERKSIGSMYRSRFVMVGSAAVVVCSALSALALLPSFLVLRADSAALAPQGNTAVDKADRAALTQTEEMLSTLEPFASSATSSAGVLAVALAQRPSGVTVDHSTYTAGKPAVVVLSGRASTPSKLDAYRKALSQNALFNSVTVPVSDLIGSQDGAYTMTLSGNF